jgi:hypothetical protein
MHTKNSNIIITKSADIVGVHFNMTYHPASTMRAAWHPVLRPVTGSKCTLSELRMASAFATYSYLRIQEWTGSMLSAHQHADGVGSTAGAHESVAMINYNSNSLPLHKRTGVRRPIVFRSPVVREPMHVIKQFTCNMHNGQYAARQSAPPSDCFVQDTL